MNDEAPSLPRPGYTPPPPTRTRTAADLSAPIGYLLVIRPCSCLSCGFTWLTSEFFKQFRAASGPTTETRLEPVRDRTHELDPALGIGTSKLPVRYELVCHNCVNDLVENPSLLRKTANLAPSQHTGVATRALRVEPEPDPDKFKLSRVWPPLKPLAQAQPAKASRNTQLKATLDDL